ncbi:hypothetical protein ACHMW7_14620 [Aminobacter sp. UC22_36]|uniref:hypothetical protein n=1 Tax=Aminobacter sp. UC22_36 TaxID=3374549 RepID=UPI00375693A1
MRKVLYGVPSSNIILDVKFVVLLAVLGSVFVCGLVQVHPPVGWVDPGLYIHWFLTPERNISFPGADYHGSRLPFILPGAFLYSVFDAVTAQALLVALFYVSGLVAIYTLAASLLKTHAARLGVTLFFAFNPLWIAAFARGYVDGPAMAIGLAALSCLMQRRPSRPRITLMVSGALLLAAICLHPLGGGIAGLTAVPILLLRARSIKQWVLEQVFMLAGACAAFLALGVGGTLLGLPFFFPSMSMSAIQKAFEGQGDSFLLPWLEWAPGASRLVILPLIVLSGVAAITSRQAGWSVGPSDRLAGRRMVAAVLTPSVLLALLVLNSVFFLQYSFYASYFFLPLIPGGILLAHRIEVAEPDAFDRLLPAITAVGVLFILAGQQFRLVWRDMSSVPVAVWGVLAILILMLLVVVMMGRSRATLLLAVGILGLAGATNRDTATVFSLADAPDLKAHHDALGQMQAWLGQSKVTAGPYLIWFDREGFAKVRNLTDRDFYPLVFAGQKSNLNMLDSLAATLGWDAAAIGFDMPHLQDLAMVSGSHFVLRGVPFVANYVHLITFCPELSACEEGVASLQDVGVITSSTKSLEINVVGVPRVVIALTALKPSPQPTLRRVREVLEELFLSGPNAEVFRTRQVTINKISNLECDGGPEHMVCSFRFELSTLERRTAQLVFRREGLVWTRI